jgi:2Fe-2S ferredoxin
MQLAIENNVEGIEGACGGSCMCATCHVKVESVDGAELGERSEMELDVLEMEIDEVASNSRLGCQIEINEKIESITVRIESIQSI